MKRGMVVGPWGASSRLDVRNGQAYTLYPRIPTAYQQAGDSRKNAEAAPGMLTYTSEPGGRRIEGRAEAARRLSVRAEPHDGGGELSTGAQVSPHPPRRSTL